MALPAVGTDSNTQPCGAGRALLLLVASGVGSYTLINDTEKPLDATPSSQYQAAKELASVWGLPEPPLDADFVSG